ncbi:Smr/MutS family protein [Nitrospirillum bahiense]|uniref:DNA-nicking Smr family endonuclease n=1 Tax=Nitrospirillum amazonense TaxID=28077 RepID=A0A560FIY1_9PROT|nr:Smr/MutS family protein [Nitrospirillum amazonense]TWB21568.1 DNA-nicking Smr family endonuclease [Nitrospirillum amazonense]
MSRQRRSPTSEEIRLWREVMRDAAPLRRGAPLPPPPPAPVAAAPAVPAAPPLASAPAAKPLPAAPLAHPPLVFGARAGLDRRTDDRLRRGQLVIDGRLDLHGMTQAEAHGALNAFVARAHREGRRTLLVITGKGSGGSVHMGTDREKGILRVAVPRWLGEAPLRPLVLAIRQAQPQHGGGGALYVLLKRQRP